MKKIPIPSIFMLRELFSISSINQLWWKIPKRGRSNSRPAGGLRPNGYRYVWVNGKKYAEHRIIWALANRLIPPEWDIDHINGKRADNRLENLRAVRRRTNILNKSNIPYCYFYKPTNKWMARGTDIYGKAVYLGYHILYEEAHAIGVAHHNKIFAESLAKDEHDFTNWLLSLWA